MNKPFKPEPIVPIFAEVGVSISDLKRNPAVVMAEAERHQVAILNRNRPVAYVISPDVWEAVLDLLDEQEDYKLVEERLGDLDSAIPVKLEDLV